MKDAVEYLVQEALLEVVFVPGLPAVLVNNYNSSSNVEQHLSYLSDGSRSLAQMPIVFMEETISAVILRSKGLASLTSTLIFFELLIYELLP